MSDASSSNQETTPPGNEACYTPEFLKQLKEKNARLDESYRRGDEEIGRLAAEAQRRGIPLNELLKEIEEEEWRVVEANGGKRPRMY